MTFGATPLISPHEFKRPRIPMKSAFRTQRTTCFDQILLATHLRKRNCVVQVVYECGGSRPDCILPTAPWSELLLELVKHQGFESPQGARSSQSPSDRQRFALVRTAGCGEGRLSGTEMD
jgi:hypothetical protein